MSGITGLEKVQIARTNIILAQNTQELKLAEVAKRIKLSSSVLAMYLKNDGYALRMQAITERIITSNRLC